MARMDSYHLHRGSVPLLVSLPHDGSAIPEAIAAQMTPTARRSPDTDWHVGKLYAFAADLGASIITPHWSRYVVDLNRPRDGHALYPGREETGVVTTRMFSGEPVYRDGSAPDAAALQARLERWWQPYHDALAQELGRLRAAHGRVVLWDGHSIRARVPMLFDGRLPDLNLGTAAGASCSAALGACLERELERQTQWSHVRDGRFKGGYITRHYGRPDAGIEAVQMEMVQAIYMDEATFAWQDERAAPVSALLRTLLEACLEVIGA